MQQSDDKTRALSDWLPLAPGHLGGPVILLAIVLLAYAMPGDLLAFDAAAVRDGQWWRLLTGNWTHANGPHLLLNGAAIALLWLLHGEHYRTANYLGVVLICSAATTLTILVAVPELNTYVGLSGVLHGLFAWGIGKDFTAGRKSAWLLAIGLVIKLGAEMQMGGDAGTEGLIGLQIATEAHLAGSVTGAMIAAAGLLASRKA